MSTQTAREAFRQFHMQPALLAPQHAVAPGADAHLAPCLAGDLRLLALADFDREQVQAARRQTEILSAYGYGPTQDAQAKPFAFADGAAIIPIHGTLLNRFAYSWGFVTGYDFIRSQMKAAAADPDVKSIVFDVNSPGGMVAGCEELAADIRSVSADKPTLAVVDAGCFSAAYWLASAATKISLTPSGQAGSIGCVAMHMSYAGALEQMGLKATFVFAGQHKVDGNPYEVLPDDVKAAIQKDVDAAYDKFVSAVAVNRGISEQAVRDTEARVYRADEALSLKLVDAIAAPGDAVQAWNNELSGSDDNTGDDTMATETKPTETATQPDPTAISAAVAGERIRIAGITGCEEAEGRATLANHLALNTDLTLDAARAILGAAPKEQAAPPAAPAPNAFEQAMNTGKHPNVGSGEDGQGEGKKMSLAQAILADQAAVSGTPVNNTKH